MATSKANMVKLLSTYKIDYVDNIKHLTEDGRFEVVRDFDESFSYYRGCFTKNGLIYMEMTENFSESPIVGEYAIKVKGFTNLRYAASLKYPSYEIMCAEYSVLEKDAINSPDILKKKIIAHNGRSKELKYMQDNNTVCPK